MGFSYSIFSLISMNSIFLMNYDLVETLFLTRIIHIFYLYTITQMLFYWHIYRVDLSRLSSQNVNLKNINVSGRESSDYDMLLSSYLKTNIDVSLTAHDKYAKLYGMMHISIMFFLTQLYFHCYVKQHVNGMS